MKLELIFVDILRKDTIRSQTQSTATEAGTDALSRCWSSIFTATTTTTGHPRGCADAKG
jgi:hypothetical protein